MSATVNKTTPVTQDQHHLEAFLLRAKYTYGWLNLESSARRMVEHAVDEIEALTKERDALAASAKLALDALNNAHFYVSASGGVSEAAENLEAIEALRQVGVE